MWNFFQNYQRCKYEPPQFQRLQLSGSPKSQRSKSLFTQSCCIICKNTKKPNELNGASHWSGRGLLCLSFQVQLQCQTLIWWRCCWSSWSRLQMTSHRSHWRTGGYTTQQNKMHCDTSCTRFPLYEVVKLTFGKVWTAQILTWRKAPEKLSKPGWPVRSKGWTLDTKKHLFTELPCILMRGNWLC